MSALEKGEVETTKLCKGECCKMRMNWCKRWSMVDERLNEGGRKKIGQRGNR